MIGFTRCYKTAAFTFIFAGFQSQTIAEILLLPVLENKRATIWKFCFRFGAFYRHRHVILHRRTKFYPNWTISDRDMMLCRFSKMAAIWRPYRRKSTSAFRFYDISHLGRQRTICTPNFDQISQFTAAILLLPLPKTKRSPF